MLEAAFTVDPFGVPGPFDSLFDPVQACPLDSVNTPISDVLVIGNVSSGTGDASGMLSLSADTNFSPSTLRAAANAKSGLNMAVQLLAREGFTAPVPSGMNYLVQSTARDGDCTFDAVAVPLSKNILGSFSPFSVPSGNFTKDFSVPTGLLLIGIATTSPFQAGECTVRLGRNANSDDAGGQLISGTSIGMRSPSTCCVPIMPDTAVDIAYQAGDPAVTISAWSIPFSGIQFGRPQFGLQPDVAYTARTDGFVTAVIQEQASASPGTVLGTRQIACNVTNAAGKTLYQASSWSQMIFNNSGPAFSEASAMTFGRSTSSIFLPVPRQARFQIVCTGMRTPPSLAASWFPISRS